VLDLFESLYQRSHRGYVRSLDWVMGHRFGALVFSIAILIGTFWLGSIVPKGFIPGEDTGQLMGLVETGEGTSFTAMARHQQEVMRAIHGDPNVEDYYVSVGTTLGGRSLNQGRIMLHLKPRGERELDADAVARHINSKLASLPGIRVFITNPPAINIGGRNSKSQYQYTLQSGDIDELYRAAAALEARLKQEPMLQDVTTDLQIKNPEVDLQIDRDRASSLGVSATQIESALYDAYGGRQVSTIYTDANQYWVILELLPEYQKDLEAFRYLSIRAPNGELVPLASLAKINETLRAMDEDGQINEFWNKWLGPATEYKVTRTDKVVPLAELKFTPIP